MTPGSGTVVDARASLALWLRDGRARKKLSLDDVARITKIQSRILEKLEAGQLDGLPAEVFVKGFVRSFARCVGLDESEALDRYTQCRAQSQVARALVETMSQLAPSAARVMKPIEVVEVIEVSEPVTRAEPVIEAPALEPPMIEVKAKGSIVDVPAIVETPVVETPVVEAALLTDAPAKKKRTRKKAVNADGTPKAPRPRKKKATPVEASPVVEQPVEASPIVEQPIETAPAIEQPVAVANASEAEAPAIEMIADEPMQRSSIEVIDATFDAVEVAVSAEGSGPAHGTWRPTMPPLSTTSSVPWRRPAMPTTPSLVIDDADPDRAEREQEERASSRDHRVSFLPPILLDREDRSARQGGLTLAVIILLIAATLTLSYLMRRPSVSGNGVTMRETPASLA